MHRHSAAAATIGYALLTVTLTWPRARGWFGSPVGCFALVSVFALMMSFGPRSRQISEWVRAHDGRELAVFGSDRVLSVD
jgi:hypothetical protein